MKKILLSFLGVILFQAAFCQTFYNGSPGFVGGPEFADAAGNAISASTLKIGAPVKLRVGFQNTSFAAKIPNATLRIQIDLGNKLVVNPSANYNITKAPLNQYFSWSVATNGTNQVIVGTQKTGAGADIPAGFIGNLEFEVNPADSGTSSIVGNILLPNTNPVEKTADPVDNDNSTSLSYNVVTGIMTKTIKFANVFVQKSGCNLSVNWVANNKASVRKYEIEVSKNDTVFNILGVIGTHSSSSYISTFAIPEQLRGNKIYLRIKQTNTDGEIIYSQVLTDSGICDTKKKPA